MRGYVEAIHGGGYYHIELLLKGIAGRVYRKRHKSM